MTWETQAQGSRPPVLLPAGITSEDTSGTKDSMSLLSQTCPGGPGLVRQGDIATVRAVSLLPTSVFRMLSSPDASAQSPGLVISCP